MKIKTYRVWYSNRASAVVHAKSVKGARARAWEHVAGGYQYGWTKSDFLRNASVKEL